MKIYSNSRPTHPTIPPPKINKGLQQTRCSLLQYLRGECKSMGTWGKNHAEVVIRFIHENCDEETLKCLNEDAIQYGENSRVFRLQNELTTCMNLIISSSDSNSE